MRGPTWRIDDEDGDPSVTGAPRPLLVTGRSLKDALVRTWPVWVGAMLVGALLGLAALYVVPHRGTATTTLLMIHPDPTDPAAMTTDVNLLQTRVVADRVIADLGLTETPEAFLSSVTVDPVTNQILTLTVTGPDDRSAVDRATSLVEHFLQFRGEQLRSVSQGLVSGSEKRVADLQAQVEQLTREYDALSAQPTVDQVRATDILTERATLGSQISTLQRSIEDTSLQTEAAVTSTHVIDPPATEPRAARRQILLFAGSGAIVAGALAVGMILLRTLTSDRLRRRRDVAAALGVPVRVGVGPVHARGAVGRAWVAVTTRVARLLRGHPVRWTERRRHRNLEALVSALESALPSRLTSPGTRRGKDANRVGRKSGPTTLGLAAIGRADTGAVVLRALGERLAGLGVPVLLVDLSSEGALAGHWAGLSEPRDPEQPVRTFRPEGDPTLAPGPRRSPRRPAPDPEELGELATAWDDAAVVLALVEVDPGMDLDVLRTWVNRVVPFVSAGRASQELLATIAVLLEQSGLEVPFALLEGVDRSDQSLGQPVSPTEEHDELGAVESR
jgi:capsular polysaccharide biosynthesis protein